MRAMLIGVDGGASGVRVYEVIATEDGFALGPARAERTYGAADMVEAAATCIAEVAGGRDVLCGICMPGLKTEDGRGIARMVNGPAIPDYLDRLEERLGISVARLWSDGFASGVGEEVAGLFRGVRNAYYLGGGTGIAECLKLDGRVRALDELELPRAWELGFEGRRRDAAALIELIRLRIDAVGRFDRVVLGQHFAGVGPLPDLPVVSSRLREAPGLGAAALAYGWRPAQ